MKSVFWQKHPALRLLLPFCAGIYIESLVPVQLPWMVLLLVSLLLATLLYQMSGIKRKFFLTHASGLILQLLIFCAGLMVSWKNDISNRKKIADIHQPVFQPIAATLEEPLSEKPNSYKAVATVRLPTTEIEPPGKAILYFDKDSSLLRLLEPGTSVVFRKPLQEIRNSGNPGSFDYKTYCLRQGISHQVYLKKKDISVLHGSINSFPEQQIFRIRTGILDLIRQYIPGRKQQGLAEALLIGYRDDLDRSLVQAYSNTGVVHVIAISGLHLGIIYSILVFLTAALNRKGWYWLRFVLIIGGLWSFTLIAGAQASVLRSAVMFSFVAAGVVLKRNASVINSLALSALLLLCWKPQWLWDVGFQLSYSAVLSIVLFFKHVYGWVYIKNKIADIIWKMTAVTISAQLLTVPLTLYYFHQFPLLLLITNLVAVPLSSGILIGEILLIVICPLPLLAGPLGMMLGKLIEWMNVFIETADSLPFNTWSGLELSQLQVVVLYFMIGSFAVWLLRNQNQMALVALTFLLLFVGCRSISLFNADRQKKLVVYNIARTRAAEVIIGRKNLFIGSDSLLSDTHARSFYFLPSWRKHRITETVRMQENSFSFAIAEKTICFLQEDRQPLQEMDVLVISGKSAPPAPDILQSMKLTQVVIDASVSYRQTHDWKKQLMKLNIPCHDVKEQGAFVMNL